MLRVAWNSTNAETLIIDFVPVALSTDTINGVEVGDAAALSIVEHFIDSASNDTETCSL
jgi:hypothetical protein